MRWLLPVIVFVLGLLNFIDPRVDLVFDSFQIVMAHQTKQCILIRYLESGLGRLYHLPVKSQIVLVMRGSGRRLRHPRVFLNLGCVLTNDLGAVVDFILLLVVGSVPGFKMLGWHYICTVVSIERLQGCLVRQDYWFWQGLMKLLLRRALVLSDHLSPWFINVFGWFHSCESFQKIIAPTRRRQHRTDFLNRLCFLEQPLLKFFLLRWHNNTSCRFNLLWWLFDLYSWASGPFISTNFLLYFQQSNILVHRIWLVPLIYLF